MLADITRKFLNPAKRLIVRNVPLPGAYPAIYNRPATGPAASNENPDFRKRKKL
jgi:hypothetical protein